MLFLRQCLGALAVLAGICFFPPAHANPVTYSETVNMPTLWIEEMTWTEIQGALKFGYTNILVPIAGIQQNGPHLPLYKHRLIVRKNADAIARRLGNTLIAPVIDFVPAGAIESREGHMNYAGTISIPSKVLADVMEYTIRSLNKHGFSQFFLIGDSGSTQPVQEQIAKAMHKHGIAVLHVPDYYDHAGQLELMRKQGFEDSDIGGHAGLRDTAEFMAISPDEVRDYQLGLIPKESQYQYGAWGNTSRASGALGEQLSQFKIHMAIAQICRDATARPSKCRR